ncbi:MAG: hypothetical protein HOW73_37985 [Polyangiaceae bacterium]|nr:hypothetical protein [Polyangiaceae bacterium]
MRKRDPYERHRRDDDGIFGGPRNGGEGEGRPRRDKTRWLQQREEEQSRDDVYGAPSSGFARGSLFSRVRATS